MWWSHLIRIVFNTDFLHFTKNISLFLRNYYSEDSLSWSAGAKKFELPVYQNIPGYNWESNCKKNKNQEPHFCLLEQTPEQLSSTASIKDKWNQLVWSKWKPADSQHPAVKFFPVLHKAFSPGKVLMTDVNDLCHCVGQKAAVLTWEECCANCWNVIRLLISLWQAENNRFVSERLSI